MKHAREDDKCQSMKLLRIEHAREKDMALHDTDIT
jgi:hypothetical protein